MTNFSINQPDKNKKYFQRIGAYGFIINNDNLLALVKTKTGYFLPGGGIENNETLEDCLIRECYEEIGFEIKIIKKICSGNYFFYSTNLKKDMESIGHFYKCKINNILDIKTEDDHELVWLTLNDSIKLLYLENQKEAIRLFLKSNAKNRN